ncbi:hypothetical protein ABMC89_01225 [Sulfitobacter sp. HNIBRBA3233]|uniref:hypothetical protein n=1 Tax=Sulfitobacter marinivivus TaxID=3158558 RepID=UPI0032DFFF10
MPQLVILAVILAPQVWAARRGLGPAGLLTLLLLSICALAAGAAAAAFSGPTAGGFAGAPTGIGTLSTLGYAMLGLAVAAPLYWAMEQVHPSAPHAVDRVLAQTLALALAAAVLERPFPGAPAEAPGLVAQLTEVSCLALVLALLARSLWTILRPLRG